MSELRGQANVQQAAVEAVVVRCGCAVRGGHPGIPCPNPARSEDLGTVAYYHRSPLVRLWYRLLRRCGVKHFWRK